MSAVQNIGRHDGPVFGEGEGQEPGIAVFAGTGRNLRPVGLKTLFVNEL
jgi:hypothetical protein